MEWEIRGVYTVEDKVADLVGDTVGDAIGVADAVADAIGEGTYKLGDAAEYTKGKRERGKTNGRTIRRKFTSETG